MELNEVKRVVEELKVLIIQDMIRSDRVSAFDTKHAEALTYLLKVLERVGDRRGLAKLLYGNIYTGFKGFEASKECNCEMREMMYGGNCDFCATEVAYSVADSLMSWLEGKE